LVGRMLHSLGTIIVVDFSKTIAFPSIFFSILSREYIGTRTDFPLKNTFVSPTGLVPPDLIIDNLLLVFSKSYPEMI